jgi:hypothetical protein
VTKAKRFPLPFRARWLLALPALLLAHAGLWWFAAARLEAEAAAWAAGRRAEGWQVAHGPPVRGGWPGAAALTLPSPRIRASDGLGWQAEVMTLRLPLAWPPRLHLVPGGAQALLAQDQRLPLEGRWQARFALSGAESTLTAEALAVNMPAATLALRGGSLRWQREGGGAALLDLNLEGLTLPLATPLGAEVQRLALEAAFAPAPGGLDRGAARAWQQAGGQVAVPAFELRVGPLAATATAQIALDAALQPAGQATLRVRGLPEVLEALVAAGLLPARNASALRVGLALLQRPAPDGGPPRVELPLAVVGRRLTAAGFTLGELPVLDWPEE